eukprot:CAMPEP_0178875332 /NCGR_PEP_ID=MMETSP0747-20121128/9693_1 /TAXON_ID=913974 /ORGANISM="Nitzschia punctata, Strain CCMP561" /LENGTH=118 /DNA_ID=CAMNT_0020542791 /DNA_START=79 /DNA_END=435 /DNA_ORIENTATION=-
MKFITAIILVLAVIVQTSQAENLRALKAYKGKGNGGGGVNPGQGGGGKDKNGKSCGWYGKQGLECPTGDGGCQVCNANKEGTTGVWCVDPSDPEFGDEYDEGDCCDDPDEQGTCPADR